MKPRWKNLYEGAYCLNDHGPAGEVSMFLLVGRSQALLIDSGYGLLNLPERIRQITNLPVTLVNTHGHLDHANGSWQFERAYLRSEDMDVYRQHASKEFLLKSYAGKADARRLEELLSASPANILPLDDISEFDLGGRKVTVLPMPGHTRGSVCLLDEENHAAFTGDNLCRSIWLSLPESVSVEEYQETLKNTLSVMQEKDILWNYSAHKPRKENIQDVIHRFLQCCDAILTGSKKPRFMDFGVTSGNFIGKAGRYILYRDKEFDH